MFREIYFWSTAATPEVPNTRDWVGDGVAFWTPTAGTPGVKPIHRVRYGGATPTLNRLYMLTPEEREIDRTVPGTPYEVDRNVFYTFEEQKPNTVRLLRTHVLGQPQHYTRLENEQRQDEIDYPLGYVYASQIPESVAINRFTAPLKQFCVVLRYERQQLADSKTYNLRFLEEAEEAAPEFFSFWNSGVGPGAFHPAVDWIIRYGAC